MMDKVVDTFPEDERATLREALKSWRFPYWDWAAKKPDPNDHSKPANYNVPVVLPYKGVEIKVPPTFRAEAREPSFTEGQVWSDPSPVEPGERRHSVANPFYQFQMHRDYENMGDPRLGDLKIVGSNFKDSQGTEYHFPVSN